MNAIDIRAVKTTTPISSVIAPHVRLVRAGREWKACCPFHEDRTPSFTVNDDKGFYHCFGCGAHGDLFDFIQAIERVGLRQAAERVVHLPVVFRPKPALDDSDRTAEALTIWRQAVPIKGTLAEMYLRSRRLICALPESLRFARLPYGKRGPMHPCLVALVASAQDCATGIQRTYLNASGTGKANVPKQKLSLGRIRGGAIRLAPAAGELVVCEGLEDGLTLQQELGVATWVAAGVGNLRTLDLPAGVRAVVIGADADASGMAGARAAAERFVAEGRKVRIIQPYSGFKDFNDELREIEL
jgi:DNA primase